MLGAGLIKIRGDKCWTDLTCMNYHYEVSVKNKSSHFLFYNQFFFKTQPVPNPIAYYMHREPDFFHKFEVLVNHFVELVVPFFVLVPYFRKLTIFGGIIQIIFQVWFLFYRKSELFDYLHFFLVNTDCEWKLKFFKLVDNPTITCML
jgi:hypothetical protein